MTDFEVKDLFGGKVKKRNLQVTSTFNNDVAFGTRCSLVFGKNGYIVEGEPASFKKVISGISLDCFVVRNCVKIIGVAFVPILFLFPAKQIFQELKERVDINNVVHPSKFFRDNWCTEMFDFLFFRYPNIGIHKTGYSTSYLLTEISARIYIECHLQETGYCFSENKGNRDKFRTAMKLKIQAEEKNIIQRENDFIRSRTVTKPEIEQFWERVYTKIRNFPNISCFNECQLYVKFVKEELSTLEGKDILEKIRKCFFLNSEKGCFMFLESLGYLCSSGSYNFFAKNNTVRYHIHGSVQIVNHFHTLGMSCVDSYYYKLVEKSKNVHHQIKDYVFRNYHKLCTVYVCDNHNVETKKEYMKRKDSEQLIRMIKIHEPDIQKNSIHSQFNLNMTSSNIFSSLWEEDDTRYFENLIIFYKNKKWLFVEKNFEFGFAVNKMEYHRAFSIENILPLGMQKADTKVLEHCLPDIMELFRNLKEKNKFFENLIIRIGGDSDFHFHISKLVYAADFLVNNESVRKAYGIDLDELKPLLNILLYIDKFHLINACFRLLSGSYFFGWLFHRIQEIVIGRWGFLTSMEVGFSDNIKYLLGLFEAVKRNHKHYEDILDDPKISPNSKNIDTSNISRPLLFHEKQNSKKSKKKAESNEKQRPFIHLGELKKLKKLKKKKTVKTVEGDSDLKWRTETRNSGKSKKQFCFVEDDMAPLKSLKFILMEVIPIITQLIPCETSGNVSLLKEFYLRTLGILESLGGNNYQKHMLFEIKSINRMMKINSSLGNHELKRAARGNSMTIELLNAVLSNSIKRNVIKSEKKVNDILKLLLFSMNGKIIWNQLYNFCVKGSYDVNDRWEAIEKYVNASDQAITEFVFLVKKNIEYMNTWNLISKTELKTKVNEDGRVWVTIPVFQKNEEKKIISYLGQTHYKSSMYPDFLTRKWRNGYFERKWSKMVELKTEDLDNVTSEILRLSEIKFDENENVEKYPDTFFLTKRGETKKKGKIYKTEERIKCRKACLLYLEKKKDLRSEDIKKLKEDFNIVDLTDSQISSILHYQKAKLKKKQ